LAGLDKEIRGQHKYSELKTPNWIQYGFYTDWVIKRTDPEPIETYKLYFFVENSSALYGQFSNNLSIDRILFLRGEASYDEVIRENF